MSENSVPLNPLVLLIIIPFLNGYFIGNINPTFSDKPIPPFFGGWDYSKSLLESRVLLRCSSEDWARLSQLGNVEEVADAVATRRQVKLRIAGTCWDLWMFILPILVDFYGNSLSITVKQMDLKEI